MGRVRRVDVGGMVYQALNRVNFRSRLFKKEAHYQDFLDLMILKGYLTPFFHAGGQIRHGSAGFYR
jgi:hypothetical protein